MRNIITGIVLLTLLVGALAACGPTPAPADPQAAAEAFLNAMGKALGARQDPTAYTAACAELYKLLSDDTRATVSPEDFEKMLQTAWTDAGVTAFEVRAVKAAILSKSGNRASVPYQAALTTREGTTEVYNALSLVLQDGKWLVIWPPAR